MSRVLNQAHDRTDTSCTDLPQSGNHIQNITKTSPLMDTANSTIHHLNTLISSPIETDTDEDSFHSAEETPILAQTKNQRRKVATKRRTLPDCCFQAEGRNHEDIVYQPGTHTGSPHTSIRLIQKMARVKQVFPLTTAKDLYDIIIDQDPGFDCDLSGYTEQFNGKVQFTVNSRGHTATVQKVEVEREIGTPDPSYKVDLSKSHCKPEDVSHVIMILDEYSDVFATHKYDLGLAKVEPVDIPTTDEEPIGSKFLRIPYKLREEVRKHEAEMLHAGVMRKSATPWVSCWVVVPKKDGTQRPCIDFRPLNSKTITDPFPLPRLDGILERIANCQWYTSLDLCNGYLQIPLTEKASQKCGVITEEGVFQLTRMPFGLKNAPGAFMRIMKQVFEGYEDFVLVYIDDILIYTRDRDPLKHFEHVRLALDRLRQYGFKLPPNKCFFAQKKIEFL